MPRMGFEPAFLASELPQTHALLVDNYVAHCDVYNYRAYFVFIL